MNLRSSIALYCSGTSEGAEKAWDTRGRGRKTDTKEPSEQCIGPHCGDEKSFPKFSKDTPIVIPHLDNLELTMTSDKAGQNIHFDREALKSVLRMALVQLDAEDHDIRYMNSPLSGNTDHYVTVKFRTPGVVRGAKEVR